MKHSKVNRFIEQAEVANVGELIRCRKRNNHYSTTESMWYAIQIQAQVLKVMFDNRDDFWKTPIQKEVQAYHTLCQEYYTMTFEYHTFKHLILIADEDPEIRQLLKQLLEKNNYTVISATNGEEVLKLVQFQPKVIILDVYKPLSRLKVCRRLRHLKTYSQYGCIPIILFSTNLSKKYQSTIKQLGGIDWIEKPVRTTKLLEQIKIRIPGKGIEMIL